MKCQIVNCVNKVPSYPEPTGFRGLICKPHLEEASRDLREKYLNALSWYVEIHFATPENVIQQRLSRLREAAAEIAKEIESSRKTKEEKV